MCCSDGPAWWRHGIANEKMVQTLKRYIKIYVPKIYVPIRKPVPKKEVVLFWLCLEDCGSKCFLFSFSVWNLLVSLHD